jgi:hypothetical protein
LLLPSAKDNIRHTCRCLALIIMPCHTAKAEGQPATISLLLLFQHVNGKKNTDLECGPHFTEILYF